MIATVIVTLPALWKQTNDALRARRRHRGRAMLVRCRSLTVARRQSVIGPLARPAIEEAPFGGFLIVGDHEIDLPPCAPRIAPAAQAGGLEPHQHGEQQEHEAAGGRSGIQHGQQHAKAEADHQIADQDQPKPVPEQPKRPEHHGPQVESVAHEHEPVRFGARRRGGMHCVDRHVLVSEKAVAGSALRRFSPSRRGPSNHP
jgi:hypothetical protein